MNARLRYGASAAIAVLASLPSTGAALAQQWEKLPRMQLERQFAGPLKDTLIQRWRDQADGTICYIYLPISAQHSEPTATGFVQYGPNTIGSISCVGAGTLAPMVAAAPPPAKASAMSGAQRPVAPPPPDQRR